MTIPETYFSVNEELSLLGLTFLLGAAFGVLWDIFRAVRMLFPHNSFLVAAEDIVFFALYAVSLLCLASAAARGEMRFYYFIGSLSGFTLYLLTVGSVVSAALRKVIFALRKTIGVVSAPLRKSFVLLRKKAGGKFVGISEIIVQKFKKAEILLLKPLHLMYNKQENKLRRNGNNGGEKIKKSKKGSVQRSARKARRGRSSNRLRSYKRDSQ